VSNMGFIDWLVLESMNKVRTKTHEIDIGQIESVYDKAHVAVQIVQMYEDATKRSFLQDITTIANLTSGAYGLYNSKETSQMLPPEVQQQQMMYYGRVSSQNKGSVPLKVLKQYLPPDQLNKVKTQGVIRVNVKKIMDQFPGDTKRAVLEIAATIIHECRHEIDRRDTGQTNEQGPKAEEQAFLRWAEQNWDNIAKRLFTQINGGM
jgi:hypothetical protein